MRGKIDYDGTRNTRKPITPSVIQQVRRLAGENTPTRVIGLKAGLLRIRSGRLLSLDECADPRRWEDQDGWIPIGLTT